MTFYTVCLFFVSFYQVLCSDVRVLKSGYEACPSSVGLQFYVDVNNEDDDDIQVELTPQQCCLQTGDELDCEVLEILGNCIEELPKGTTKRLNLIAPLPNLFNRKGFCKLHLDSKANEKLDVKRDNIQINFDTADKENNVDSKKCDHVDENPNDDCKPVNCETYYNGRKSYFSKNLNRCVEVPPCVADDDRDVSVYDAKTNTCLDGDSIRTQDIDFIKTMEKNKHEMVDVKKKRNLKAAYNNTTDKNETAFDSKQHICFLDKHFPNNNFTLIILCSVIIGQCFLIGLVFYFFAHCLNCCKKSKTVKKLFKSDPVASDTTPLIESNADTDTTNYQVLNESSIDFDKKIKSYKACQKDVNDMKSMSDDILSKCINRRTWERKYSLSNHKPEYFDALNYNEMKDLSDKMDLHPAYSNELSTNGTYTKINVVNNVCPKIPSSDKVNFVNEIQSNQQNNIKCLISTRNFKTNDVKIGFDEDDLVDEECTLLETEVRSLNYNNLDSAERLSKQSSSRSFNFIKSKPSIVSTQGKSAQAIFSNDAIDDYLSENGLYAPVENISKYSLTASSSSRKSNWSNATGKTSKHVFRNVMSLLLNKRRKQGSVSDPGPVGTRQCIERLHMRDMIKNKKSSHSSSFNESDMNILKEDSSY